MIVRIMGEGQFQLDERAVTDLNELDAKLEAAVTARDQSAFAEALERLLREVRASGEPLENDELASSDLILPAADATIDDVADMLTGEGLIPG